MDPYLLQPMEAIKEPFEASVEPQNTGEAYDGLDKVNVTTQQASVDPEIEVMAIDSFEKEDVVIEKTCIPKRAFIQYSRGESTNHSTCIFKGKITIPVPSLITDKEPVSVSVMYFKFEKLLYDMSGYWWAYFSMKYRSENILSVYGVGETVDEQYFIACETFEQSLANWLKDPAHFGHDKPLSSTLKRFFKDVINGATYVHHKSNGSLGVELSMKNVYIVNGRAKSSLLSKTKLDTATFRYMVKTEIFKRKPIPVDLGHLLDHMKKFSWHLTCVTHPLFFSASQMCTYTKLVYERIHASPYWWRIGNELDCIVRKNQAKLKIRSLDWTANVKHPTLLKVLKFKMNKVQDSGPGTGNGELDVLVEEKAEAGHEVKVEKIEEEKTEGHELKVEKIDYDDSPLSFLAFYRNLVVHTRKETMTDEEIVSEMHELIPNFLLCVHEVLTINHLFVTVGEDFTSEEDEEK